MIDVSFMCHLGLSSSPVMCHLGLSSSPVMCHLGLSSSPHRHCSTLQTSTHPFTSALVRFLSGRLGRGPTLRPFLSNSSTAISGAIDCTSVPGAASAAAGGRRMGRGGLIRGDVESI
jgi:hypothetical protein